MPLKGDAKSVMDAMRKTYGKDAEKVFYATANKQGRKPETWKKEAAATPADVVEFYLRRAQPGAEPTTQNKTASAPCGLVRMLEKRAQDVGSNQQPERSVLHKMRAQLPNIRAIDTLAGSAVGAGVGGAAGLLRYLLRSRDERKGTWWGHLLGGMGIGAAGGAVAGNVVGDRVRRYLSNQVVPVGYNKENVLETTKPTLERIWRGAILDKPDPAVFSKDTDARIRLWESLNVPPGESPTTMAKQMDFPVLMARRELLRRGFGVHTDHPSDYFVPRADGTVDFSPRLKQEDVVLAGAERRARAYKAVDGPAKDVLRAKWNLMRRVKPGLGKYFGNYHVKEDDENRSVSITDVWDVAPNHGEKEELEALQEGAAGDFARERLKPMRMREIVDKYVFDRPAVVRYVPGEPG